MLKKQKLKLGGIFPITGRTPVDVMRTVFAWLHSLRLPAQAISCTGDLPRRIKGPSVVPGHQSPGFMLPVETEFV